MKNKILFALIIISSITITSCKKTNVEPNAMDFKFIGVKDTIVGLGETFSRELKTYYLGGDIEDITFTNSQLPNGVEITYSPSVSKPDLTLIQKIKVATNADTGYFNINVIATGAGRKVYMREFKLHIPAKLKFAPSIALYGNTTVILVLNSPYFEQGFRATDIEDGDISSLVQITNPLNINLVGQYFISYKVIDSDGNKDSVVRKIIMKNDLEYLNTIFNCKTTNLQTGTIHNWITSFSASDTLNNEAKIFKISDCFQANPVFKYNPAKDSIYLSPQTFLCITPTDTMNHTFEGQGKITVNGANINIVLFYTDTYLDPGSGNVVTIHKKDEYSI